MPIFIKQGNTYVEHVINTVSNTVSTNAEVLIAILQSDPTKKAEDILNDK